MCKAATKAVLALILMTLAIPVIAGNVVVYSKDNYGQYNIGPGYAFAYSSIAISPGYDPKTGLTYTQWHYDYFLENLSSQYRIVSWTTPDTMVNSVLADATPLEICLGLDPDYKQVSFEHPQGVQVAQSTITWSDGHTTYVDIFVIPEPGSCLALATGLVGLAGYVRRRRTYIRPGIA